ncbi:MAG: type I restriction endonuclease [Dysgonomonas sp.]|nr:type I restriction endonuclease [Dysgonomonas sp.]
MDFKDVIKQLSERVEKLKGNLQTEEATKNALVMPMLQALGYDVFNPLEVVPEFICDIGTKKGEKIDYAIMANNEPILLIECKHWNQPLTLHDNQLLRYFHVSKAKFGVLTNGIIYRFYTDLETPNKMDEKPFLEINLNEIKSHHIDELKKFHKAYFDVDNILSSASELKYTSELKNIISNEFSNPTPEFVKLFAKQVYDGMITPKVLDQFTTLVKKSIASFISDTISERLKTALKTEASQEIENNEESKETKVTLPENVVYMSEDGKIVTTQDEIDGYNIVKAILYDTVDINRVVDRDTNSYFGILFDDNNRKPICRLYFNSETKRYIATFDENKVETKNEIMNLSDIYKYSKELRSVVEYYINQ